MIPAYKVELLINLAFIAIFLACIFAFLFAAVSKISLIKIKDKNSLEAINLRHKFSKYLKMGFGLLIILILIPILIVVMSVLLVGGGPGNFTIPNIESLPSPSV